MRYLIVFTFLLLASALNVVAQDIGDRALITVTGTGEIRVVPDEVVFTVEVNNTAIELDVAQATNDEKVKRVLALAANYQIKPENVQTKDFSIKQEFHEADERRNQDRLFLGYLISKTIVFVLKDVKRAESFLSDLIRAGVSGIDDVDFRTSEIRKHREEARRIAIKAAQEKASALAQEIGQTTGRAYRIQEGDTSFSNGVGVSANGNRGYVNNFQVDGSPSFIGTTLALGQITITATVTVSFELK